MTSSPNDWRVATVSQIHVETTGLRTFTFTFDEPVRHLAGQHYEIRLTSDDGYQAGRLYSAASIADGIGRTLQLTIAIMPYGEISPYLFRYVKAGTKLELRVPFGGHFVWTPDIADPVLLIGGGTGIVPLRAMRLAHLAARTGVPMQMLYSVRSAYDMAYKSEFLPDGLHSPADVAITFTGAAPKGWTGFARRIDMGMLAELLARLGGNPLVYVCGPTPMVESVGTILVAMGIESARIKTERFGPSRG
ncbi:oxidoreductase [Candidatus Saccharibacteria bacterium]|nr:oxidoreductase [Candidatus Saccharibacteria bacterium]